MHSADPSPRRTVLVFCFGNLCRSPMAEGLLRQRLAQESWNVISAGTHAVGDDAPTHGACDAIRRLFGIDISDQRSAPLTVDLLRDADFVFAMSRRQALEAAALLPQAAAKIRLLGAFAPASDDAGGPADPYGGDADAMEIADPMGGDAETYESCCRRLHESVSAAADWLHGGGHTAGAPPAVAEWP